MSARVRFICHFFAAILFVMVAGTGYPAQTVRLPLTLEESVERALRHNLQLEAERLSPRIVRQEVIMEEALFDPELELSAGNRFRQRSLAASELEGAARPRSEVFSSLAALRKLVRTGAVVSLESRLVRSETNSQLATLNPAYETEVSLNLRQPLLRGRGEAVRAARDRSRIGARLSEFEFSAFVMDVVMGTELAYYGLSFALEELELRLFTLGLAESFLEEVEFRREAGAADALDVVRAEVTLSDRREALVEAEQRVHDRRDALLNLIGQYDQPEALEIEVVPSPLADVIVPPIDAGAAIDLMRSYRPEYLFAWERIEQFELDMRVARNLRLPRLDVGGGVGYTGLDGNTTDSFRDLGEREGNFWRVEATFTVPIGMREERAQLRRAELLLDREVIRLQRFEQDLLVEARSSVRAVESARERVELSRRFISVGQRQYEMEEERFRAGVSTSRDVLDAQAELENARLREIGASISLHESLSLLRRATGQSLSPYDVEG